MQGYKLYKKFVQKWDAVSRRFCGNQSLIKSIQLFLVDEVHLINDEDRNQFTKFADYFFISLFCFWNFWKFSICLLVDRADVCRGHVLEAIVSRLKAIKCPARFIAVSATFPNVDDVSIWLGGRSAVFFKFNEDSRPVKLNRVVIGKILKILKNCVFFSPFFWYSNCDLGGSLPSSH